ncbi:MAG: DUF58 domain-containing protein [Oscillospiraceae bacterium]|nr:DUF58 domain-containing protein [Oscillospiraceae bacterium]
MLPTYLILVFFIGIFHILYKGDLSFILLVFLIAMPIIMFVILAIQTKLLTVTLSSDGAVTERGRPSVLRLTLNNRFFLPITACKISVRYIIHFAPNKNVPGKYSVIVPVNHRDMETVSLNFSGDHCGSVEVSIKNIVLCDFLGITRLRKKINFREKIIILPCVFPVIADIESSFVSDSESNTFSQIKSGDDPSEIFQLREYRDGDRHNRIHWKLSSRSESFIVKELSLPISSKTLILCDFSGCKTAYYTDAVLDMAATISSFMTESGTLHTVAAAWNDLTLMTEDISDADKFYAAFGKLCADISSLEFKTPIAEAASIADDTLIIGKGYSRVLVVTAAVSKASAEELSRFCGESRLTIFCISSEGISDAENSSAEIICGLAEELSQTELDI